MEALADGVLEFAVSLRYERFLRPEEFRWDKWIGEHYLKIKNSLDELNLKIDTFSTISISSIALGCALGYLNFRISDQDWRENRPILNKWRAIFEKRNFMIETVPK